MSKLEEEQRELSVRFQRVQELRVKLSEALTKQNEAQAVAWEADSRVKTVEKDLADAVESVTDGMALQPDFDTLEKKVAQVHKMQDDYTASHVGSSNQGKASTHR